MNPYAEALAWALVHFVWQGAALALAAFLVVRWLRPSAGARYATGVATLALMLAAPVVTFGLLARTGSAPSVTSASVSQLPESPAAAREVVSTPNVSSPNTASQFTAPVLVLAVWLSGVALFSLRLFGGWVVARRMVTRAVRPVAPEIAVLARRVAARLGLDRVVRVVESSAVSVPVMVGWLKPVVLLPAAALTGLTPTQLEALLAHELAHVLRHDYLVNLLQSAVETLLFYHPAVWWVSKQVRAEREHCCDDVAVRVCDRLAYVTALAELAAMRLTPSMALAATDGSLVARVARLLGRSDARPEAGGGRLAVMIAVLAVGVAAPVSLVSRQSGPQTPVTPARVATVPEQPVAVIVERAPEAAKALEIRADQIEIVLLGSAQATSAEQARQREIEAAAARLRAAEAELSSLNQERVGLDRLKVEEAMKQQRAAAEADLKALRQEYERAKRLFDVGLLNGDALAAIESKMHRAELEMAGVQRELNLRMYELAIGERKASVRQMMGARVTEYDKARQDAEAIAAIGSQDRRAATAARDRVAQLERQLMELRVVLEQGELRLRAQLVEPEVLVDADVARSRDARLLADTTPVTDPKEPIRAGDVLAVDIKGETDLPRAYAVQNDGTIRLPLLGSIKVVGLRAQQAGQAITKQIARVNPSASVSVSLRRARLVERRER